MFLKAFLFSLFCIVVNGEIKKKSWTSELTSIPNDNRKPNPNAISKYTKLIGSTKVSLTNVPFVGYAINVTLGTPRKNKDYLH